MLVTRAWRDPCRYSPAQMLQASHTNGFQGSMFWASELHHGNHPNPRGLARFFAAVATASAEGAMLCTG